MALEAVGSNPATHPRYLEGDKFSIDFSTSPSSSGLGLGIFDPATGVRLPLGTHKKASELPIPEAFLFAPKPGVAKHPKSGENFNPPLRSQPARPECRGLVGDE